MNFYCSTLPTAISYCNIPCFCPYVLYQSFLVSAFVASFLLLPICVVWILASANLCCIILALVYLYCISPFACVSFRCIILASANLYCILLLSTFNVSFLFLVLVHAFVSFFILSFLLVSSLLWPNLLWLPSNCIVLTLACLCDCWKHESFVWIYVMLSLLWALRRFMSS